jgi:hypothetical protein
VPLDSVLCTKTVQSKTCHSRVSQGTLRYNSPDCPVCHRTVQCTSGATAPWRNGRLQKLENPMNSEEQCAQSPLPESEALPSVGLFAECLLSGTRQRRLCREPPSVKLGSRQRASLPSAGHSAPDPTRQRHLCRVSNTRQRGLSTKRRQRPSKS